MDHGLRDAALGLQPDRVGLRPTAEHPRVWQVFMEMTRPQGVVASLVVVADGSVSIYTNTGGGILGAGEHEAVRASAGPFLRRVEAHLSEFVPATSTPLPQSGRVRFYVKTFDGLLTAEASEEDLNSDRHPLSPVFDAGHDVITAVRITAPKK